MIDTVKLEDALSVAKGEQPAASITVNGHTYVPKKSVPPDHVWLVTYEDGRQSYAAASPGLGPSGNGVVVAVKHMVRDSSQAVRIAELESELAGCKIALEQAWESNRERQAEIERLSGILSAIGATDAEHPGDGDYSRGWMQGRWSLKKMALRAIGEMGEYS